VTQQRTYPVVILAGGMARRLGLLSRDTPKSLVDVNGSPFVVRQLRLLKHKGVEEVILCVGHLGEQIQAVVQDGRAFGLKVHYSVDGPHLRGTGGAVQHALSQVSGPVFYTLYGDSYLDCDFAAIQGVFEKQQKQALMTVFHNEQRWDTSNVEFTDCCIQVYDKSRRTERMRHIDYGLGIFRKEAFAGMPVEKPWDLATLYQQLLVRSELAAYEVTRRFYEIGTTAGLNELRQHLAATSAAQPPQDKIAFDGSCQRRAV
jgi:NDP-sugar pyrophosphorylase family protein